MRSEARRRASQEETHEYAKPVLPRLCDLAFLRFLSILQCRDASPRDHSRERFELEICRTRSNEPLRSTDSLVIRSSSCRNDRLRYRLLLLATCASRFCKFSLSEAYTRSVCIYMYVYVYMYINRSRELEGEAAKRPTSLANRSKRYLYSLYTFLPPSSSIVCLPRNLQLVFFFTPRVRFYRWRSTVETREETVSNFNYRWTLFVGPSKLKTKSLIPQSKRNVNYSWRESPRCKSS